MCGIGGICAGQPVPQAPLREMAAAMRHRGPDDAGEWWSDDGRVGLVHRRLSIIDLSAAGRQPMAGEGSCTQLVYNGEVYNFAELRATLGPSAASLRSHTDTEVILRILGQSGASCVERLRGMFAFAAWDDRRRALVLARDRFGKKPLYYYLSPRGDLLFASEMKALLTIQGVARRLSRSSLMGFFRWGSVPEPDAIVEGVKLLPPGSFAEFEGGKLTIRPFWPQEIDCRRPAGRGEAVQHLKSLLLESVRLRLVSDVPLGVFLSGGIDSTSIVALLREAGVSEIRTFTARFREPGFDEGDDAAETARQFGTRHVERSFDAAEVWNEIPRIVRAMDQPTVDGINTYFISKVAREGGVTVALSGLGADELFGGYPSFHSIPRLVALSEAIHAFPGGARVARWAIQRFPLRDAYRKAVTMFEGGPDSWAAYRAVRGLFPEEQVASLMPFLRERATGSSSDGADPPPPLQIGIEPATSWARTIAWYELRAYMLNQLLRDTDVMSMAHSLEVRCPFLDHVLAESVLGLPDSWVRSGRPKQLLVEALAGRLPPHIVNRPKRGFMFPMAVWIRGAWKKRVEEVLFSGDASDTWLDRRFVAHLWDGFQAGRVPWGRIWALVVLKMWIHEHHVKD